MVKNPALISNFSNSVWSLTHRQQQQSDKGMFIKAYKESKSSAESSADFIEAVKVEKDGKDSTLEDFFISYRGIAVECYTECYTIQRSSPT